MACQGHYFKKGSACHFEYWGSVRKYEGYLTPIWAKLIRHFAENISKTQDYLFKPHTDN